MPAPSFGSSFLPCSPGVRRTRRDRRGRLGLGRRHGRRAARASCHRRRDRPRGLQSRPDAQPGRAPRAGRRACSLPEQGLAPGRPGVAGAPGRAALRRRPRRRHVQCRAAPDRDILVRRDVLRSPSGSRERIVRRLEDVEAFRRLPEPERRLLVNFHTVGCAIRRSALRAHPFREIATIGEDMAWAQDVLEAGWRIVHEPASVVLHSHAYGPLEILRLNVDDGIANRAIVGRTMGEGEVVPLIQALVRDDWRYLAEDCRLAGGELDPWRFEAAVRRTAQVVGHWIGANHDGPGRDLAWRLSRIEATRAGTVQRLMVPVCPARQPPLSPRRRRGRGALHGDARSRAQAPRPRRVGRDPPARSRRRPRAASGGATGCASTASPAATSASTTSSCTSTSSKSCSRGRWSRRRGGLRVEPPARSVAAVRRRGAATANPRRALAARLLRRLPLAHLEKTNGALCEGPNGGLSAPPRALRPEGPAARLRWGLRTAYFRRLLARADRVICPPGHLAAYFRDFGGDGSRIVQLPLGIGLAADSLATPPRSDSSALTLAFFGIVTRHKGVHLIVDAIAGASLGTVELRVFGRVPDAGYARSLRRAAARVPSLELTMFGEYSPAHLPPAPRRRRRRRDAVARSGGVPALAARGARARSAGGRLGARRPAGDRDRRCQRPHRRRCEPARAPREPAAAGAGSCPACHVARRRPLDARHDRRRPRGRDRERLRSVTREPHRPRSPASRAEDEALFRGMVQLGMATR